MSNRSRELKNPYEDFDEIRTEGVFLESFVLPQFFLFTTIFYINQSQYSKPPPEKRISLRCYPIAIFIIIAYHPTR